MKKIIMIGIICFGVWQLYQDPSDQVTSTSTPASPVISSIPVTTLSRFSCDGRQHCSQMTSRAEAEFFTSHCPNTKMDGDNDGHPCENDTRF